jgi:hypothetical protein
MRMDINADYDNKIDKDSAYLMNSFYCRAQSSKIGTIHGAR